MFLAFGVHVTPYSLSSGPSIPIWSAASFGDDREVAFDASCPELPGSGSVAGSAEICSPARTGPPPSSGPCAPSPRCLEIIESHRKSSKSHRKWSKVFETHRRSSKVVERSSKASKVIVKVIESQRKVTKDTIKTKISKITQK